MKNFRYVSFMITQLAAPVNRFEIPGLGTLKFYVSKFLIRLSKNSFPFLTLIWNNIIY